MKKLAVLALALVLVPKLAFAESKPVTLFVNGIDCENFENPPILRDDRLFLPLRSVIETMGFKVDWDEASRTVSVDDGTVEMTIGKRDYINHAKKKTMDVAPFIEKDRTYVPVRFVAESMGVPVHWDGEHRVAAVGNFKREVGFKDFETRRFGDVRLALPKGWEKNLLIRYENGEVRFYDKRNYEMEKGMGYIGSIEVGRDIHQIPVRMLLLHRGQNAYTLFTYPGDVQVVDIDDKALVDTYSASCDLVEAILKTAEVKNASSASDRVK